MFTTQPFFIRRTIKQGKTSNIQPCYYMRMLQLLLSLSVASIALSQKLGLFFVETGVKISVIAYYLNKMLAAVKHVVL